MARARRRIWRQDEIAYVCHGGVEAWSPASETTGIGGAEEAVICLTRALATLGWRITVYNSIAEAAEFDGVRYLPLEQFRLRDSYNVVVSWRSPGLFVRLPIDARQKLVDLHDALGDDHFTPATIAAADRFFFKSRFHRQLAPHLPDVQAVIAANGILVEHFADPPSDHDPRKVIYAALPEKGLEHVVRTVWPAILARIPDAQLHWFYGWQTDSAGPRDDPARARWRRRLRAEMAALGIHEGGRIGHRSFADELATASIWIHPTTWPEISCITALKAQAAGCTPITSGYAALQETVLEAEEDLGADYHRAEAKVGRFVERVVERLLDPEPDARRRERAETVKQAFSWPEIAEVWDRELRENRPGRRRPTVRAHRRRASYRPTICLSMIVRNEEAVIRETLASVSPYIDYWVIVDTGSNDRTIDVVRSYFDELDIPGEVHERPWRDFGTNRTQALELARGKADYTWVIDADDLVVGELEVGSLAADSYLLRYGREFAYWRRQIFRSELRWRYEGVLHEYPVCLDSPLTEERLDGPYFVDSRRLGDRNRAPDKYARDAGLLLEAVDEEPEDARRVFYLAQSYFDAGDYRLALHWYSHRATLGGWGEEVFYSLLKRATCLERLGEPWEQIQQAYLECWRSHPRRGEPLYEIARHYRGCGEFELGYLFAKQAAAIPYPETDTLFVRKDVYDWRTADDLSICAYYTKRYQESFELCAALLDGTELPETQRERVTSNRDFSARWIKDETLEYPAGTVRKLARRRPRARPRVTVTITSCQRPELFEKTVNSFLNCCRDLDRIDRWICIDDGSSLGDRSRMQALYPFFEFVWKEPAERGHARSMNMLLDLVETPFWLHLEDDWHFFVRDRYVGKALEVLQDDPRIGQVLFNRNYGEALEGREIVGGSVRHTRRGGIRYRAHEYVPVGTPGWIRLVHSLPRGGKTNAWWPHYSLRPSLLRTERIRELGRYDPEAGHFELEFAERYAAAGYISVFLDSINCLHIGRRTWEIGHEDVPNAYALNEEGQFGEPRRLRRHRVKVLGSWTSSRDLCEQWARQSEDDRLHWQDIELVHEDDADYYAVLNFPGAAEERVPHDRAVVFQLEPRAAIAGWGAWASPDPRQFLQVRSRDRYPSNVEWHLGLTYEQLMARPIVKTRDLSAVVSGKAADPGQRLRVEFLRYLEAKGTTIDIYGRDNVQGFRNYRGSLPFRDKQDGIVPYRYTFAAENHSEINYVTEKLVDAILGECVCFYWGCPNLEELVDREAFIRLPLEDFEQSRRIVDRAIRSDEWSRRIETIRAEKQRLLNEEQLFPTLARIVHGDRFVEDLDIRVVNLDRRPDRWESFLQGVEQAAGPRFAGRCRRFPAVDGAFLQMTDEIRHTFRGNDFGYRRAVVACALSHLAIWKELASREHGACLVFEDDATLRSAFLGDLVELCGRIHDRHETFDIVFLGHSGRRSQDAVQTHLAADARPMDWQAFRGGGYAYVVSGKGARRLLELAERNGVRNGIDWFLLVNSSELDALEAQPHLAFSVFAPPGSDVDSDIQHDFARL